MQKTRLAIITPIMYFSNISHIRIATKRLLENVEEAFQALREAGKLNRNDYVCLFHFFKS